MDFSQGAGAQSPTSLMPNGQLAWAIVTVKSLKANASTGTKSLELELTLDDNQPYARKKIWPYVGDPFHAGNSENYRQMGMLAITRMLECGRNAGPNNPAGYQLNNFDELNGLRVAIKIGVEKGKDGYEDKNKVAEYLTPNPASGSGHKDYQKLMAGEHSPGGAAKSAPAATSGFANAAAAKPAPTATGFGEQKATVAATPVNPNATSGWLAQANAGAIDPGPDEEVPY